MGLKFASRQENIYIYDGIQAKRSMSSATWTGDDNRRIKSAELLQNS